MDNISIFVDTSSDIPNIKEHSEIKTLPIYYYFSNENIEYGDDNNLKMREFFYKVKMGAVPRTAAVNIVKAEELFEKEIKNGNDIICICLSSALSSSYNNILIAKRSVQEKYPDSKITIIDSLTGSLAEGLIALKALKLKNEGNSYEEIVSYIEKYKNYYNIEFFIDNLNYLIQGGRISKTAATLGQILKVKPLVSVDAFGKVQVVEKIRSTKKINSTLIERMLSTIDNNDIDSIGVVHSDNLDGALKLQEEVKKLKMTDKYIVTEIGPVIASHIGPGGYGLTYKMKNKR